MKKIPFFCSSCYDIVPANILHDHLFPSATDPAIQCSICGRFFCVSLMDAGDEEDPKQEDFED